MAMRKRLFTYNTLETLDTSSVNVSKCIAVLTIMKEKLQDDLPSEDLVRDYDNTLWTVIDLLHEIQSTSDKFSSEEPIYADTLEEYLEAQRLEAKEKAA